MPSAQPHLASWERRLLAAAIDGALLLISALFIFSILEAFRATSDALVFLAAAGFVAYHSAALMWPELSLGRTVAGIVVLSFNGSGPPSSSQAVTRPVARLGFVAVAYGLGNLVDVQWIVAVPVALELALMAHTPWRRTLVDLVAGTVVVNKPPLQPHRAPAYPMYSAKDEEFGPKP